MIKRVTDKKVVNTGQYRKCLNHQTLEILSTLNTIGEFETVKRFSGTEYRVTSVDGNTHSITLFTNKLWDLILLKLTELVSYDRMHNRFRWDEHKEWAVYLSVKTVADCLGISTRVDSLTHLYDRIVAATEVLRNASITVTKGKNSSRIDGYLECAAVRDCSDSDDERLTKSNAIFGFVINPELIDYLSKEKPAIYHFNHSWLHMSGRSQNAYAAAKRLGRHYSQNTYGRINSGCMGTVMKIETLKKHLPSTKGKKEKDYRVMLDNALSAIPGVKHVYMRNGRKLTFEELTELRLHTPKYNMVSVAVIYDDHPNTSKNKVTTDLIKRMNDDSLYLDGPFFLLEDADFVINHKGVIKDSVGDEHV